MSISRPSNLGGGRGAALDAVAQEALEEQASTLGRLGRRLEAALAALDAKDAAGERADRVREAGTALYELVVFRECVGFHGWEPVVRAYGVPAEVVRCAGAVGGVIKR